ncbi:MAG: glycosyltransferase family 29 protein [Luteolibacter sp.]
MELKTMDFNELQQIFEGRRIALVGNAQSIFGKNHGAEIDAHDVVMRFNYGEIKSPRDQGSRTDVYGLSDARITWDYIETNFHPRVVVWLTPKPLSEKLSEPNAIPLFRTPETVAEELSVKTSPGRPSSGLIASSLVLDKCGAASIDLYGFDFFETRTFYHGIRWRFWRKRRMPHVGSSERKVIESMGIAIH